MITRKFNFLLLLGGTFGALIVENYRLTVNIQDRYARSEIAVHVRNSGSENEEYNFGVKLDENEFISGLTMRVGDKVTNGTVHEKEKAKEIYKEAKRKGQNAGLTSQSEHRDTSFNTKVNIPPGEDAYFWLTYEENLARSNSKYKYLTNLNTFGPVQNLDVKVNILESRPILNPNVLLSNHHEFSETKISENEINYFFNSPVESYHKKRIKIEYDVTRPQGHGGDILIRDGYFVHFISPDELDQISKNIIFVIDKSGSMYGKRMEMTKEAFRFILNDLDDRDMFNIVQFDHYARTAFKKSQGSSSKVEGLRFVNRLGAGGGTNLFDGLQKALQEPETEAKAQIIFLLSDGETNEGIINWNEIRDRVRRQNEDRFAIFTFAIGDYAPIEDLEKLSIQNNGLARQIIHDSDVEDYVKDFYKSVAVPLLWDMDVAYQNAEETIMSNRKLFRGEEVVIVGELTDPCSGPNPKITAQSNGADLEEVDVLDENDCSKPIEITPPQKDDKLSNPNGTPKQMDLQKMFAYLQIRKWQRELKGAKNNEEATLLEKKITQLSLKHGFVTKFTSMVVTEDIPEKEENKSERNGRRLMDYIDSGMVEELSVDSYEIKDAEMFSDDSFSMDNYDDDDYYDAEDDDDYDMSIAYDSLSDVGSYRVSSEPALSSRRGSRRQAVNTMQNTMERTKSKLGLNSQQIKLIELNNKMRLSLQSTFAAGKPQIEDEENIEWEDDLYQQRAPHRPKIDYGKNEGTEYFVLDDRGNDELKLIYNNLPQTGLPTFTADIQYGNTNSDFEITAKYTDNQHYDVIVGRCFLPEENFSEEMRGTTIHGSCEMTMDSSKFLFDISNFWNLENELEVRCDIHLVKKIQRSEVNKPKHFCAYDPKVHSNTWLDLENVEVIKSANVQLTLHHSQLKEEL